MKLRHIFDLAVLFIIGFFMMSRLGGIGKLIGLLFIAAGIIFLLLLLRVDPKDAGIIKKHEKKQKDEIDKRDAEIIRYAEEIEKLEKYDIDSGLGYCAHCGNYSVKEGRCEVCGEKTAE